MRKFTFLTFLISAVITLGFHGIGFGQLLLNENFDYAAATPLTSNGWVQTGTTVTNPILVSASGLNFAGYLSSGIGNAADMTTTGQDVNNTFAMQTTGSVYAGFLVSVSSAQTTGDYFIHFAESPITGNVFKGRVFIKKDAATSSIAFGISKSSTTVAYTGYTYALNTTYLIVLKYQFVAGTTTDDNVSIYINPSIGAPEPGSPTISYIDNTQTDALNIGLIALRQGSATSAAALQVDGIRIGLTWPDVVPAVAIVAPTIQAHDITFSGITANTMTATWTNGDGAKRITLVNTTNTFTSPADGADPVANPVYGGSGQQVIYNGTGNTIPVTGLVGNTTYWYRVYEYNGTGSSTKYLTTTATLNPNSQVTPVLLTPPAISLPTVAAITNTSATLGGTVTYDGGTVLTERGTVWNTTPGVTITNNKLPEGSTLTGIFSHPRTGLPPQTHIYFKAFASNSVGTSLTGEGSFFTLSDEPASHVTGFTATTTGNTSINLTWSAAAAGADGYIILQKAGPAAPSGIPADGTDYLPGSVLGDGVVAAIVTPGSALNKSITGLSSGTQYSFTIIPFAWDGANNQTYNYYTAPVIPASNATTTGVPSTIYTWQGADNGSWGTPGNWNPTRTTPTTADILQFNDGTTKTVTGVTTQTISKLVMASNTTINLQSAAAAVLTITGSAGTDLEIPAGCSLNLNAANAISIIVATTATGSISGNMKFSATATTAHRLTGADPGSIVFNAGSTFTAGSFFSGNPFGTSSLNSVIFAGGSAYLQLAGSNPFGAGQPNSVVIFQTGSLFKVMANLSPSFSGRTYANFEMDATGVTLTPTGGSPVSIDNLTITNGTFNFNMTGPTSGLHQVKGNILVQAGAILNFTPASATTLTLSGTTPQSVTVNGTMTMNSNLSLEIAGNGGVSLNSPLNLNGNLELTSGFLTLGSNNLNLSATSAIIGTPSSLAMVVATGTGKLQKSFVTGFTGSFIFPVGDNTGIPEYSPVTLNFSSGVFATGNFTAVNLVNAKFPSDPNTSSYLNRYWNVTSSAITAFNCSAIFQYVPADVTGTNTQIFSMQVVPAPFTDFGIVDYGLYQVIAPGLSAFGTFTGSQPKPAVVTNPANLIGPNSAALNGEVIAMYNTTAVSFEYGLTASYGSTVIATPATVNGGGTSSAFGNITGLTQNTTYHFRIVGTNVQGTAYGNDLSFTTTCPAPSTAGTITGPANVCKNGSGYVYTVPVIANATSYVWTLPAGASITAGTNTNSITVSFSAAAVSGNITVYGTSVCGAGTPGTALAVTVIPQPVPAISGPASVCINSTGNIYTTEAGMTGYAWTVSTGGTITGGSTSNSITVSWGTAGPQTVTVTYINATGCTPAVPSSYALTVVPLPVPTISGPGVVCANAANIVYSTEAGMTSYNWAVSIGGTIISGQGTNAITVSWPYAGNRTVSVTYTNPTGCVAITPTVYNVTINPAAVPYIGSSNDPCINSTNNQYLTNTGMTNYVWNVSPGGVLVSGQGTSTINVTWNSVGAQWVNVSFTNSFGCTTVTPTVYNLFVNPLPNAAGPVTGTASLCAGTNGVGYSCAEILNATAYVWTLPAGATIASGAGTNDITVNFAANAVSGTITVAGNNSCGNGSPSPGFTVTVNAVPPAPVVTVAGNVITSSASGGNQWYREGTGAIAGATGQILYASQSGWYWSIVTLNGCSSPPSNHVYVVMIGQEELQSGNFTIYPVPSEGKFTVSMTSQAPETFTIMIYNQLGDKIYELEKVQVNGMLEQQIDLRPVPNGLYSIVFSNGTGKTVRKVLINR
ncbi:MAG: T9SS type A sorting domain-containing protein [Bacteroidetes bacterium]|nr:T9SS type A sorting domain-containing protein [Bacteroidota bacterium]